MAHKSAGGTCDSRVVVVFDVLVFHNTPAILITHSPAWKHKIMCVFHFLIKIFIYLVFHSTNKSYGRAHAK